MLRGRALSCVSLLKQFYHNQKALDSSSMIVVLSPAKTLDLSPSAVETTEPALLAEAATLVGEIRRKSLKDLKSMLGVSDNLARENYERYQSFLTGSVVKGKKSPSDGEHVFKGAVFAYKGPAYLGLAAETLDSDALAFAQEHLRIISGLYGALRPLDAIQPYRLDMGTKLRVGDHKDLYQFWGSRVAEEIAKALDKQNTKEERVLVNCASDEYFKAVDVDALQKIKPVRIVHCVFQDRAANGAYRVIGVHAKRARGLMCRYIFQHRVNRVDDLRGFDLEGYRFFEGESSDDKLVFRREPQRPAKRARQ